MDVLKNRRSVRKYKKEKIPSALMEKILDAGRWAPSAHNLQPWRFIVIDNADVINNIRKIMQGKERDLFAGFNVVMRETAKCLETCPFLIAIYGNGGVQNKLARLDEPYAGIGRLYEIQSVSFAAYGMMLYAHSIGLGSACLGVSLFCEKEINDLINQKGNLIALLSMGYPDEVGEVKTRKPVSEISAFI
jgi:nitroreductase